MSIITIIGSFAVGFLLACVFIGDEKNTEFYEFCKSVYRWVNKKKNDKKEIKKK